MKKIKILTSDVQHINYPKKAFEILYKIEDKHFWFAGRNEAIKIILNRFLKQSKKLHFLEIGCGNGIVLALLEKLGFTLTGLDIELAGLKIARKRTNVTLICADIYKLKSKDKYDAIGLFDVVEHIQDDESFLKKSKEFLKTDGKIILTVPADMRLWSQMDKASGHQRRYTRNSLTSLLRRSGFRIEFISYFNCLFYIPQLLFRRFSNKKMIGQNDNQVLIDQLKIPPLLINIALKWLISLEAQLLKIISIPFGASLIIVGSKKDL